MDWGEGGGDNPMREFSSMPQVLGHEVVAEVVALGPEAEGVEIGDRVVLNPWLSCVPRGVSPICPACEVGDLSLCWNFQTPPHRARHPHRHVERRPPAAGPTLMPAHPSMLFPVPDYDPRRGRGVRRPVRGVAARDHPAPAAAGRQGARVRRGRARDVRDRDPRARSTPTSRSASSRASARRPTWPASSARTRCSRTSRPRR